MLVTACIYTRRYVNALTGGTLGFKAAAIEGLFSQHRPVNGLCVATTKKGSGYLSINNS